MRRLGDLGLTATESALLPFDGGGVLLRPLRYAGMATRNAVAENVQRARQAWLDEWIPKTAAVADYVATLPVCEAVSDGLHRSPELTELRLWQALPASNGAACHAGLWWRSMSSLEQRQTPPNVLAAALFESSGRWNARSGLAVDLVESAWGALCENLANALPCIEAADPNLVDALNGWSGAMMVRFPLGLDQSLVLLVDASRLPVASVGRGATHLQPMLRTSTVPLVSPLSAVAGREVLLQVTLDPVELELGILAEMQVGDVLRTAHRLDVRLHLLCSAPNQALDTNTAIGSVSLGQRGMQRAVELLRDGRVAH